MQHEGDLAVFRTAPFVTEDWHSYSKRQLSPTPILSPMNEYVLSIDLSQTPSPILLGCKEGEDFVVLERDSLDLSIESNTEPDRSSLQMQRLHEITSAAEKVLATTIVVAAPSQLIGLNVSVPPAKDEERARAIALLLEDTLPFETEEFLFHWHSLERVSAARERDSSEESSRGSHQFHVAGAPQLFVQHVIDSCRALGIEPHRICPPAAALSGVLARLPASDAPILVITVTPEGLHQLVGFRGISYVERFVPLEDPHDTAAIARETLALCLSTKRQLGCDVSAVFTIGVLPSFHLPSIPVKTLPLQSEESSLADLAAHAFLNHDLQPLLTNFRTGELAINPLIHRIIQFSPAFAKALGSGLLAIAVLWISLSTMRERQISQLESEISRQVAAVLPGKSVVPGGEVQALRVENTALNRQLSDLSSAITVSAIDALSTVFRDLPDSKQISLTSLELIGKAVRIKGLSQDYAEIEKLENHLRKRQTKSRKQIYCRIKKELPTSGLSDKVAFRFELRICNVD